MESQDFQAFYRVVVFVPKDHAATFRTAIEEHIPPLIEPPAPVFYDRVLWWSETEQPAADVIIQRNSERSDIESIAGTEQFRALHGANPAQGQIGETAQTPAIRMEFSFPDDEAALSAFIHTVLRPAHPWEEPVIYAHRAFFPKK
ncbi:MAG: hypothetical protein ACK4VI_05120 [Alphaproteobacteria bacterium]